MDKKRRDFIAERFCFRGSVDDWIHLSGVGKLKNLAETYVKLLGTDEFYDSFS